MKKTLLSLIALSFVVPAALGGVAYLDNRGAGVPVSGDYLIAKRAFIGEPVSFFRRGVPMRFIDTRELGALDLNGDNAVDRNEELLDRLHLVRLRSDGRLGASAPMTRSNVRELLNTQSGPPTYVNTSGNYGAVRDASLMNRGIGYGYGNLGYGPGYRYIGYDRGYYPYSHGYGFGLFGPRYGYRW